MGDDDDGMAIQSTVQQYYEVASFVRPSVTLWK